VIIPCVRLAEGVSPGFSFQVSENARATLEDNEIRSNRVVGVVLRNFAEATIVNNRINHTRPNAQGQFGRGIRLLDRAKASIVGNTIRENASQGILLGSSDRAKNIVRDNRGCGVHTDNDRDIKITGQNNIITGNTNAQLCGTTSKFPAGFGGGK
jgi:parallel beta-helix repeat protein